MMADLPSLVHPGQFLGSSSKYAPGSGTHLQRTSIYASRAGRPTIMPNAASLSNSNPLPLSSTSSSAKHTSHRPQSSSTSLPVLTIPRILPSPTSPIPSISISNTNSLPAVGSIVLCRVTRLMVRQVDVIILAVGDEICGEPWKGILRREDIRIGEKGESAAEGFRIGDLVRGRIISLGDQSSYYLSTEGNELGVFMARSEAGNQMYPISWKEFKDPVTGATEIRKVAKPI